MLANASLVAAVMVSKNPRLQLPHQLRMVRHPRQLQLQTNVATRCTLLFHGSTTPSPSCSCLRLGTFCSIVDAPPMVAIVFFFSFRWMATAALHDSYSCKTLLTRALFVFIVSHAPPPLIRFSIYVFRKGVFLAAYLVALAITVVAIVVIKHGSISVGRALSALHPVTADNPHRPMDKIKTRRKFAEQAWQLAVHVSMGVLDWVVMDPMWWNDTRTIWIPHPDDQPLQPALVMLYIMQTVRHAW